MRSVLVILLITLGVSLHAQITITANDMPASGDTFRMSLADTLYPFDPNESGPGQYWDYSDVNVQTQELDSFVSLQQVDPLLAFAFYGRANLAVKSRYDMPPGFQDSLTAGSSYEFFDKTSGNYNMAGTVNLVNGVPISAVYDEPDTIYTFPLNFQDTFSSYTTYSTELPTIGGMYSRQWRNTIVDGYGTVATPLDTFQALRVRSEVYREDSISYQGTSQVVTTTTTEYKWLAKGAGVPVFEVHTTTIPAGQEIMTLVKFKDQYEHHPTGVKTSAEVPAVRVCPSMAAKGEAINIELADQAAPQVLVTMFGPSGKVVWDKAFSAAGKDGSYRIRPGVNAGMYILQVKFGSRNYTEKVVITH